MLACVAHGAGDLRIDDLPDESPGPNTIAVAITYGGICGSDLHYYHRGRVGDFVIRQPLVLGHEVVGRVLELGEGVAGPAPGTAVAFTQARRATCVLSAWVVGATSAATPATWAARLVSLMSRVDSRVSW